MQKRYFRFITNKAPKGFVRTVNVSQKRGRPRIFCAFRAATAGAVTRLFKLVPAFDESLNVVFSYTEDTSSFNFFGGCVLNLRQNRNKATTCKLEQKNFVLNNWIVFHMIFKVLWTFFWRFFVLLAPFLQRSQQKSSFALILSKLFIFCLLSPIHYFWYLFCIDHGNRVQFFWLSKICFKLSKI